MDRRRATRSSVLSLKTRRSRARISRMKEMFQGASPETESSPIRATSRLARSVRKSLDFIPNVCPALILRHNTIQYLLKLIISTYSRIRDYRLLYYSLTSPLGFRLGTIPLFRSLRFLQRFSYRSPSLSYIAYHLV